jgi:hypothetical protein
MGNGMPIRPAKLDYEDLLNCGHGRMFGPGNAQLPLPPMLMFDRITRIAEAKLLRNSISVRICGFSAAILKETR